MITSEQWNNKNVKGPEHMINKIDNCSEKWINKNE